MRILLVLEACDGGAGRHVIDLTQGLLARGHQVSLRYSPQRAGPWFLAEVSALSGLDSREISIGRAVTLNDFAVARQLRRSLATEAPYDIMHAHSSKAGAVLRLAQAGRNTKVIYTPHAPITMDPEMPAIKKVAYLLTERILAGLCKGIICVSPAERDHLLGFGFRAGKLHVICNGIGSAPAVDRDAIRRRLNLDPDSVCFGCVGRMSHQKAVDRAIRAFALVAEQETDARLVLVGDGPDQTTLKTLVAELGITEQVIFTGAVSGSEMMAAFDVFLLPSRYEGMPYVLLEAAARKLPIIMADVGGAHLVVRNEENGFVIPVPQIESYAARMLLLARDSDLRRKMADRSAAIAAEFSLDKMVEQTLAVYKAALSAA